MCGRNACGKRRNSPCVWLPSVVPVLQLYPLEREGEREEEGRGEVGGSGGGEEGRNQVREEER